MSTSNLAIKHFSFITQLFLHVVKQMFNKPQNALDECVYLQLPSVSILLCIIQFYAKSKVPCFIFHPKTVTE